MDFSLSLLVLTAAGLVLAFRGFHKATCPGGPRRFTGASRAMLVTGLAAAVLGLGGLIFLHGPGAGEGMHGMGMGLGPGMGPDMGHTGMMRAAPSASGATLSAADLPEPASAGARLFVRYCNACHALPRPGLHAPAEWPSVVDRMRGNMAALGRPEPAPSESEAIAAYLARHADDARTGGLQGP